MPARFFRTRRSPLGLIAIRRSSAAGGVGSASNASKGFRTSRAWAVRAVFPPEQIAEVKALACELPATHGLPLGRFTRTELHRLVLERGVSEASASTIWRWLHSGRRHATVPARPGRPALVERSRPTTSARSTRSPNRCSASPTTTARSPSRSSGPPPAPTSTAYSHESKLTSLVSRSQHDHRTSGRIY
jgi:hypothetical protein